MILYQLAQQIFYISQQISALYNGRKSRQAHRHLLMSLIERRTHPSAFHPLDHRLYTVDFDPRLFPNLGRCFGWYNARLILCRIWLAVDARHLSTLPLAHTIAHYNHQHSTPTLYSIRLLGIDLRL